MLSILFLPLILMCLFNLIQDFRRNKNSLGLHFLNFTFLYVYGLGGFYSVYDYEKNVFLYSNFYREDFYIFLSALMLTLSYLISYKSYFMFKKINLNIGGNFFDIKTLTIASNISLILCGLFIYIYISQYGGLYRALESAAAIRSGYGELEDGAKLTFVKYLMPIGVFPFLLYGYKVSTSPKILNILLWVISFLLVFLAFILMSGRTRIVIYILAMVIIFIYSKKTIKINKIFKYIPLFFIVSLFIMYGKTIFSSLGSILNGESIQNIIYESDKNETFLGSILGYFSHRTYAVEAALKNFNETHSLYWFKDNFLSIFYLIPERLTGIVKPDSISPYNTEVLTGIYEATIPPGILAYGIYSLWIPGLIIVAIMYSSIFGLVDSYFQKYLSEKHLLIILLPIIVVWGLYGSTGDFKIIINSFSYIMLFMMIFILIKTIFWTIKK
jgi:hypothetical protein